MTNLISTTNDKELKAFDPSSVAELKQPSEQELRDKIYAEMFNEAVNTLKGFNGEFVITAMENAEHPIFKERQRRNLRYNQFYSAIPPSSYADRMAAKEDARLNPAKYIYYDKAEKRFLDVVRGNQYTKDELNTVFAGLPEFQVQEGNKTQVLPAKVIEDGCSHIEGTIWMPTSKHPLLETTVRDRLGNETNVEGWHYNTYVPASRIYNPDVEQEDVAPFLRFIDWLAGGREYHRETLLKWLYVMSLQPEKKIGWALYFCGGQGLGKSVFGELIVRPLVGEANFDVGKMSEISDKWKTFLAGNKVVMFDEIFGQVSGGKKLSKWDLYNALKDVITQKETKVEFKGRDAKRVPNYCSFIFNTNEKGAISVEQDDRRFYPIYHWETLDNRGAGSTTEKRVVAYELIEEFKGNVNVHFQNDWLQTKIGDGQLIPNAENLDNIYSYLKKFIGPMMTEQELMSFHITPPNGPNEDHSQLIEHSKSGPAVVVGEMLKDNQAPFCFPAFTPQEAASCINQELNAAGISDKPMSAHAITKILEELNFVKKKMKLIAMEDGVKKTSSPFFWKADDVDNPTMDDRIDAINRLANYDGYLTSKQLTSVETFSLDKPEPKQEIEVEVDLDGLDLDDS